MSLVRFKTNKEERPMVDSVTVFNSEEVDTKQPMFFGKPLGIQRYDSYKYPVFDKLTTPATWLLLETRRSFITERSQ